MRPCNVLGISVSNGQETKIAAEPDGNMVLVASSSLRDVRKPTVPLGQLPCSLGAMSRFIGIAEDASFPDDVLAKIQAEGQASYHRYGYPQSKHVIHVAAIDFSAEASSSTPSSEQRRLGLRVGSIHRIATTGTILSLSNGSVTDFEGDAIVNAANEGCIQGAGVDDAINVAGGRALRDARMALPVVLGSQRRDGGPTEVRCPMGEVRITPGGDLQAAWCIHAVGPNYNVEAKLGVTIEECDQLVSTTYRRAVEAAKEKGLSSIAFPLVCGGMFRGKQSLQRVLEMGLTGIRDAAYPGLKEVHIVAFTPDEQEALSKACALVFPGCQEVMDGRSNPETSRAAAIGKLTEAYKNVFWLAAQLEKPALRFPPISNGAQAAHLRSVLPEITAAALARALRDLPPTVVEKLSSTVELCVEDNLEVAKYERALKEQCQAA